MNYIQGNNFTAQAVYRLNGTPSLKYPTVKTEKKNQDIKLA